MHPAGHLASKATQALQWGPALAPGPGTRGICDPTPNSRSVALTALHGPSLLLSALDTWAPGPPD